MVAGEMVLVDVPGGCASVEVVPGGGQSLVWFEGGPGFNAGLGRPDVELLAGRVVGYLIDAPGAGRSPPPATEGGYGFVETASFYELVRRALGLDRVVVAGHSWVATVALTYAAMFPDVCLRCLAVSPFCGSWVDRTVRARREQAAALDRHRAAPWFGRAKAAFDSYGDPAITDPVAARERFKAAWPLYFADPEAAPARGHIRRLGREFTLDPAAALAAVRFAYDQVELRPLLSRIACPTLVLAGELDFVCGPSHARAVAQCTPGASIRVFSDCGHMPQYEQPARFQDVVFQWWDETNAAQIGR